MNIPDIIGILLNRVRYLTAQRETLVRLGDAESIARIDAEISETQNTLDQLASFLP